MNAKLLLQNLGKKLKEEIWPFLTTVLTLTVLITFIILASVLIDENVHNGMYYYPSNAFDWNYNPADSGLVPMNSSYANYTVLFGTHSLPYITNI